MAGIASSSLPIPRGAPCPREVGVGTRFGRRDPRASAAAPVALRARRPRRPARLMSAAAGAGRGRRCLGPGFRVLAAFSESGVCAP